VDTRAIEEVMGCSMKPDVKEISSEDGRWMYHGSGSCSLARFFINDDERPGLAIIALPV
jgi:hypothetical protein